MGRKYVDLSVRVDDRVFSPPSTNVRVLLVPNYRPPSRPDALFNYWVATTVTMSVHTGSHVDVPSHVRKDGLTTDILTVDNLVSEATVVRLKDVQENHKITVEDIERAGAQIREGDVVVLNTGWSDRMWGSFPDYYVNSPHLSVEAAEYLAAKKPRAVGFDFFEEYSARLKDFKSDDFVVHHVFLDRGILLYEQMTSLSKVPDRFTLIAATVKLCGVDGAPARFIGVYDSP